MERRLPIFLATCGALALMAGCSSARPRNPFAAHESARPTSRQSDDRPDDLDRGPSPGTSAVQTAAATSTSDHDAETLTVINHELRDATPEERESLQRELRGVRPEMVRKILEIRRMGLNHRRQQLQMAQAQPHESHYPGQASTDPAAAHVTSGLGAAPWGTHGPNSSPGQTDLGESAASSGQGSLPFGHSAPGGAYPVNTASNAAVTGGGLFPNPGTSSGSATQVAQPRFGTNGFVPAGTSVAPSSNAALANATPAGASPSGLPSDAQAIGSSNPALGNLQPGAYGGPPGSVHRAAYTSSGPNGANGIVQMSGTAGAGATRPGGDNSWNDYLQRLVALAEAEAALVRPGTTDAEKQFYTEKQVYLRMLYLMSGRQERALQAIPGLEPADQEFWQQTLWGLANYFDTQSIPNTADRASQTVAQFNTAALRLQQRANLELKNAAFCQKIDSFGNYTRFSRDEFSPGQLVLLYVEAANFHSEQTPDGQYRTMLKSTLEIVKPGAQGEVLEQFQFPATEDLCRNHRRDYFHSYEFTIPARLSLGLHVLKLTVEDQLSRKIATYTLNFTVK